MKFLKTAVILSSTLLLASCVEMSDDKFGEKLKTVLKNRPEILAQAVKDNPAEFMEALQDAAKNAQEAMAKKRDDEEKKQLEDSYNNPLKPQIRADEAIRGTKGAPIVLVTYSDFECPFCARGFNTVMELLKKYEGKIQFIFKHLPLSFHENAMIASKYYEAIRMQDANKAFKFHDEILKNQDKLKNGEAFLKGVAKSVGADLNKIAKDIKLEALTERINQDMKEAQEFGIQGTPGFIINGIPVKGAYPASHFSGIVDELVKRGKLQL